MIENVILIYSIPDLLLIKFYALEWSFILGNSASLCILIVKYGITFERHRPNEYNMKLFSLLFLVLFSFAACNSNDQESSGAAAETPAEMHPPAEAVPDSLSIVNDSAIVADTSKTNKASGDTVRGNP